MLIFSSCVDSPVALCYSQYILEKRGVFPLRKFTFTLLIIFICAFMLGCGQPLYNNDTLSDEVINVTPQLPLGDYTGPDVTALPSNTGAHCTMHTQTLMWPEEAAESTAEYMLVLEYPVFDAPQSSFAAMNEAVELYRAELMERVVNERMPLADRAQGEDVPATFVTCDVSYAGEYANVIFNETARFTNTSESSLLTLVLDSQGREASLHSAAGLYYPDNIVAQQIFNIIDRDPKRYNGDVTPEDISLALDFYNGFIVTDTGYTLFVAPGLLAPADEGILSFSFTRAALYPAFAGDVISIAQYEQVQDALVALSAACATRYESFSASQPTQLIASTFITRMLRSRATPENAFVSSLPKADYETFFASCFDNTFAINRDDGDGTYLDGEMYYIPNTPESAFGLHLEDAHVDGNTIVLTGVIMYGEPGGINSGEVAPATIVIRPDSTSPIGCKLISLAMR